MTNISKLFLLVLILLIPIIHQAQAQTDTVIINFGNRSKMIFFIDKESDLETLESYDLNALIIDIKGKIEADTTTSPQEDQNTNNTATVDTELKKVEGEDILTETQDKYSYDNNSTTVDTELKETEGRDSTHDKYSYDNNSNDDDSDDDNCWRKRSHHNIVIDKKLADNHFINFDVGINNIREGDKSLSNSSVKPFGSWYLAINSVNRSHLTGKLSLEWGPGVSWYNFKFENASTRLTTTDTEVQFISSTDDATFKKSKLTASFINVNLVPVLDFGSGSKKGIKIGIGGYLGYRLGSHAKYKYKLSGSNEIDKDRGHFFLNSWRYGARIQLGYRGTNLFINYDFNDLFSEVNPAKLNAFSFGITI